MVLTALSAWMIGAARDMFESILLGKSSISFRSILRPIVGNNYFWDAVASKYGAGVLNYRLCCWLIEPSDFNPIHLV